MPADAATLLRGHLAKGKLMQLATVTSIGDPWLCHVWYAADENLDLIFTSRATRRHSGEIRKDGRVAGGIVPILADGLGNKVQGIVFEGRAVELDGNDIRIAYQVYATRWPQFREMVSIDSLLSRSTESRLYRVKPGRYVVFDEISFPDDPRQELVTW
jgi:uncharacterized protein YhbP (UPF0306 family)